MLKTFCGSCNQMPPRHGVVKLKQGNCRFRYTLKAAKEDGERIGIRKWDLHGGGALLRFRIIRDRGGGGGEVKVCGSVLQKQCTGND